MKKKKKTYRRLRCEAVKDKLQNTEEMGMQETEGIRWEEVGS